MELLTRYSNNPTLLDDLRHARQAAVSVDLDDEPELGGDRRAVSQTGWRVTDRLPVDGLSKVVRYYRSGMTARELAEKFSISHSSVKRILRRAGARKRGMPPS